MAPPLCIGGTHCTRQTVALLGSIPSPTSSPVVFSHFDAPRDALRRRCGLWFAVVSNVRTACKTTQNYLCQYGTAHHPKTDALAY